MTSQNHQDIVNNVIEQIVSGPELEITIRNYLEDYKGVPSGMHTDILSTIRRRLRPITITVKNMETDDEIDDTEEEEKDDTEEEEKDDTEEEENDETEEDGEWDWQWECCDVMHMMDERCVQCSRWHCNCDEDEHNPVHRTATRCRHCGVLAPSKMS